MPDAYLRSTMADGELVFCAETRDARELLVAEWLRDLPSCVPGQSIMLARSRGDVTWLNTVACSVLRPEGSEAASSKPTVVTTSSATR